MTLTIGNRVLVENATSKQIEELIKHELEWLDVSVFASDGIETAIAIHVKDEGKRE